MNDALGPVLLTAFLSFAGGYYIHLHTDRRRIKEDQQAKKQHFRQAEEAMPEILEHFRGFLSKPGTNLIREIVVLPNEKVIYTSSSDRLLLLGTRFRDLTGKMAILENHGYIRRVSGTNVEIYRMTEDFVAMILGKHI